MREITTRPPILPLFNPRCTCNVSRILVADAMNKAELKQKILVSEKPSSESAALCDELDEQCPHFIEGACERPELPFYEGLDKLEF